MMRVRETRSRMVRDRVLAATFTAVVTGCVCSVAAFGQCKLTGTVSTWNVSGNGNWSTGSDWSPAGAPNSSSNGVCITNGTSTVNLDINASIGSLQLAKGNTLSTNGNTQFSVFGTQMTNAGQITINGGGGTNTYMLLDNSMTLSGAGTLTLSDVVSGGGDAYLYSNNGALTLTNQSTIQGDGVLGDNTLLTINNQSSGIINANSSGGAQATTLLLQTAGGVTNTGLMEATNSGVLEILTTTVNNSGGNITANGSRATVELNGATIQGGTLNTLSSGTLENIGTSTLDGSTHGSLTLSGGSTYTGAGNSETLVLGTINNNGNIQLNGGSGTNTYFLLNGSTTLQGGGTVTLNTPTMGGGNTYVYENAAGLTLTNVNNTIQGEGLLGDGTNLAINNQSAGIINANSTGGGLNTTLQVQTTGGVTNAGLMEASNLGTLEISGTTVNNAGGTIKANSGAVVQLDSATVIQGGTITNNGGTVQTVGAATLNGSTASGAVSLNGTYTGSGNSQTSILGTINVNNNLQVNGGSGTNTYLLLTGNTTLQGGGTVTLSTTTSGGGSAYLYSNAGAVTLTNVNATIQGSGILGDNTALTVVNQAGGTINANSTGSPLANTLVVQAAGSGGFPGVVNQGLMEATNSGVLLIQGMTVNNKGGNITANGATATVELNGADIQGGTLNTLSGGTFENIGASTTLDGNTQGALTLSTGSTFIGAGNTQTALSGGTYNNNGSILVNGGGGTNTYLFVNGNTTLQGGGTLTLSDTISGGGNAYLYANNGAATLTNVNNTIQGAGIFGDGTALTVVNQASGVINANSAGGALATTLLFNPAVTATNQGLMEATNSGVLLLQGTTINNKGGNITANGSKATVEMNGATIQGGTLNTLNSGTFKNIGSSTTLDGSTQGALTLNGTFTGAGSSQTTVFGTFNNNGNVQINGGGGTNTYLFVNGNTTLQGNGKGLVTLNTTVSGGGSTYLYANAGPATLTNTNNTIAGAGIIGDGTALTIVNNGTLLANLSGQTLLLNGAAPVTNNGTMRVNAGSTMQVTSPFTNFAGNTLTGGSYVVNGTGASPGTLQINAFGTTGGEIVNNAANISLNGLNSKIVDQSGLDALTNLAANSTTGSSFSVGGGRNFTTAGNFMNGGTLTVSGGSLFAVKSGSNLTNFSGTTLTGGTYNVAGTLQFGAAGTSLVTNAANITLTGTSAKMIDSLGGNILTAFATNNAGSSFDITGGFNFNTAGNFMNSGTLTVGGGSQFVVKSGSKLTNFSGTTLTGGTYNVAGTLQFGAAGTSLATNAANITLTGTSAKMIDSSGGNILTAFATNNAGSSFDITGGFNFTTAGNFTNNGTLTVGTSNSTFKVNGNLTNFSSTTKFLTGGTYNLTGTLQFNGAAIVTNAANVTLNGPAAKIINQGSVNAFTPFTTNASAGHLTLSGGQSLTTAGGSFSNAGTVDITVGSKLTIGNGGVTSTPVNYTQTGGTTLVDGTLTSSTATSTPTLTLNGGSLLGAGTVGYGAVVDASGGTLSPGDSSTKTAKLADTGTYAQTGTGILRISIGGATAGTQYDQFNITKNATLGGTLNVALVNGFVPSIGTTFDILNYSSKLGTFSTVNGLAINGSEHFTITYNPTDVVLTVAPGMLAKANPATAALRTGRSSSVLRGGPDLRALAQPLHPLNLPRQASGTPFTTGAINGALSRATAVTPAVVASRPATSTSGFSGSILPHAPGFRPAPNQGGMASPRLLMYGLDVRALVHNPKQFVKTLFTEPGSVEAASLSYLVYYNGSH